MNALLYDVNALLYDVNDLRHVHLFESEIIYDNHRTDNRCDL